MEQFVLSRRGAVARAALCIRVFAAEGEVGCGVIKPPLERGPVDTIPSGRRVAVGAWTLHRSGVHVLVA